MEDLKARKAAADLAASLEQWTSPRLGSLQKTTMEYHYTADPHAWLQQEEDQYHEEEMPMTTPKRAKLMQRADTPVMSNSARTMERTATPPPPPPAATPRETFEGRSPVSTNRAIVAHSLPSSRSSHVDYRRYHDTVVSFLKAKRKLTERIEQQQDAMHVMTSTPGGWTGLTGGVDPDLVDTERRMECDFLKSLAQLCWDRDASPEARTWWLACALRRLGLPALLFQDDVASQAQSVSSLSFTMEQWAARVDLTPAALVQALTLGEQAPLLMQRRVVVVKALEECFARTTAVPSTRKGTLLSTSQQTLLNQGLTRTDQDGAVMKKCLALVLSGHTDKAQEAVRAAGTPWRAALWSGGQPHDVEKDSGNPSRALWRHMLFQHTEHLSGDQAATAEESAIAALLSSHVKEALANPTLRTWDCGLYAAMRALTDRTVDELLHMHNNNRRLCRPPFPGTEYEKAEKKHLEDTADMRGMNEASVVEMLASSPFDEMQKVQTEPVSLAAASLLVGQSAMTLYLQDCMRVVEAGEMDDASLRFLTHWLLYLDSLAWGTSPAVVPHVQEWKNDVLILYVHHLVSREDLWYMIVLYASLLPEPTLLDTLPRLLARLRGNSAEERNVLVNQMREYLPRKGLVLDVLTRLVRAIVQQHDEDDAEMSDAYEDEDRPSELDVSKMKALLWLCVDQAHAGQALIASNTLMRQFLLSDKFGSAIMLLKSILPAELLSLFESEADDDEDPTLINARSEFSALANYLTALQAVRGWREELTTASARSAPTPAIVDRASLSETDAVIAARLEERDLLEAKRKSHRDIVDAAAKAEQGLDQVLRHAGGFLLTDDEALVSKSNSGAEDQLSRRRELRELQVKLLPTILKVYHEVCMETAQWMSDSIDDCLDRLQGNTSARQVLAQLSQESENPMMTPISPLYWTHKVREVVNWVGTEEFMLQQGCGLAALKEMADWTAEAAVQHMCYETKYLRE